MVQTGHAGRRQPRQLLEVKRTFHFAGAVAANDPKRTSASLTATPQSAMFEP
jgi:hypothetical protein